MTCVGLADAYREEANTLDCTLFDAAPVTAASRVDGVHLDADQHRVLAIAVAETVRGLLASDRAR